MADKHIKQDELLELRLSLRLASSASAVTKTIGILSQVLRPFVEEGVRKRLELALDEALRNAYEHGNLGVSELEKIAFCEAGTFETELETRGKLAQAAGRETLIEISIKEGKFSCSITDDGDGFDWRGLSTEPADPLRSSGRGLYVIQQFFEKITFNDKGNQITLEKSL